MSDPRLPSFVLDRNVQPDGQPCVDKHTAFILPLADMNQTTQCELLIAVSGEYLENICALLPGGQLQFCLNDKRNGPFQTTLSIHL